MSGLNFALPAVASVAAGGTVAGGAVAATAATRTTGNAALAFTGFSLVFYLTLVVLLVVVGGLLRMVDRRTGT